MAEAYVDLRGIRTWYQESGEGPPLVMLHPGGVDSRALAPNAAALAEHFHVWLPERRGHGRTPDTDASYSYEAGADDMIQFLEQIVGGPARLLGMSDGAIVALHVAFDAAGARRAAGIRGRSLSHRRLAARSARRT